MRERRAPAGSTSYLDTAAQRRRVPGRWEFIGKPAHQSVRDRYVHRSVAAHPIAGPENPIAYAGC